MARLLTLCTGNAARSVMAGAALVHRSPGHEVETAGTLTVDGMPMSWRTRAALESVGLTPPDHRSRQATAAELRDADLVIALAPEHVSWVRRNHAWAAGRTATLIRLSRTLRPGPAPLTERVAALALEHVELETWEEVDDPGGSEAPVFAACARQIVDLVDVLVPLL